MGRMGFLHGNSAWKLAILLALLVFFVCVGIAHVINPDRFMKRSGVRRGGEMLRSGTVWAFNSRELSSPESQRTGSTSSSGTSLQGSDFPNA